MRSLENLNKITDDCTGRSFRIFGGRPRHPVPAVAPVRGGFVLVIGVGPIDDWGDDARRWPLFNV